MILQSLVDYYEALAAKGKIDRTGWGKVGVSYALELNADGTLAGVVPLKEEREIPAGKKTKTVLRPQELSLPAQVKKTSGVSSNFLCENSAYFLGIDAKGKPERTKECFLTAKKLHQQLLSGLSSPAAQAVCRYFDLWQPEQAAENPILAESLSDILKGANLVFWFGTEYVHTDSEIQAAWQAYYDGQSDSGNLARCMVTGTETSIARLHPVIKGIRGGQAMGNSLVSFNASAYESYGGEQGMIAPTGEYAAFAYGAALNALLADRERVWSIGDTTVVSWAEDAEEAYQDAADYFFTGKTTVSDADLDNTLKKLTQGQSVAWGDAILHPDNHYYILGLSPNAARISVRFFLRDTFGDLAKNLNAHYERLKIAKPAYDSFKTLWLWNLLNETVNQNAKDKAPAPQLAGDTLRAILTNSPYPATLYNGVQLRIRADRKVTRGRAAIVKAYLLKNTAHAANYQNYKEVLCVELNEKTDYLPYVLGRMFAVLEAIQNAANPNINTTIRDKYFSSACASPNMIFPTLVNLAQKHLRKIRGSNQGAYVSLSNQFVELTGRITTSYPKHLNLTDQGIFQLGYYQQTQKRFEKKKEEK